MIQRAIKIIKSRDIPCLIVCFKINIINLVKYNPFINLV